MNRSHVEQLAIQQIAEKCGGASVVVDVDFASFGEDHDALLRIDGRSAPQLPLGPIAVAPRSASADA